MWSRRGMRRLGTRLAPFSASQRTISRSGRGHCHRLRSGVLGLTRRRVRSGSGLIRGGSSDETCMATSGFTVLVGGRQLANIVSISMEQKPIQFMISLLCNLPLEAKGPIRLSHKNIHCRSMPLCILKSLVQENTDRS
jgi:hypothetical protein